MEIADNGFIFSDDKSKIDAAAVHLFLSTKSYWAEGIPLETVTKSIEHSLCFGIYKDNQQAGFARWITTVLLSLIWRMYMWKKSSAGWVSRKN
jgi:hypothetical protein